MNRDAYLSVHGVDADAWAARHGIAPIEVECECGRAKRTTIPIARGALRGLASPPCPCGSQDRGPYCVVLGAAHSGDRTSLLALLGGRDAD